MVFEKPSPKINYDPAKFDTEKLSNEAIVDFVCGDAHNLVLTDGGHMWSFGWNNQGQCGHGHSLNITSARIVTRV